ncbi:hypothetical protein C3B55_00299 [Candidatus Pseudomonas adelgestsugas]|uniref:Uncharacterized protein n=1 Tax=Candidatus Pseudomonas adelgestsugas TaxID=1302376 RepID=A0ABX5R7N1_9PSED|nr:hypothetical protein C3B55_00299 [Candidatus Pseudomonas adelgestsugas]
MAWNRATNNVKAELDLFDGRVDGYLPSKLFVITAIIILRPISWLIGCR